LKVAICLYGSAGFTTNLNGRNLQEVIPLDIKEPLESLKDNIVNPYSADIFIHSWSHERSEEINKILNPKLSLYEPHKVFSRSFIDDKNNTLSRFYSQMMSNKIKIDYENEKNIIYDVVLHARIDLIWFTKINLNHDLTNSLYATFWNGSINRETNLGPFDKSNYGENVALMDTWFFSNSKNMDLFSNIYKDWRKIYLSTYKYNFKLKNRFKYNAHHWTYLQSKRIGLEIKNQYYRGFDWELYRRYIQDEWTNS
jgi:hypothetical protein